VNLDPALIRPTQGHLPNAFTFDGRTLLETAYDLFTLSKKPVAIKRDDIKKHLKDSEIPTVAVALRPPKNTVWYARDNRRLFIFQMLRLKSVPCIEDKWKGNYDYKLKHFDTIIPKEQRHYHSSDVSKFRNDFKQHLVKKANESGDMLYIPRETVGYVIGNEGLTIKRKKWEYNVAIKIPRRPKQVENFDLVPMYIEDRDNGVGKKKGGREGCINHLKKMVNNHLKLNGKDPLF